MVKNISQFLKTNPFLLWTVLFLVSNLAFKGSGGTNELSRYATLRAMSQDQTFSINPYVFWTIDWSKTPDGSYYSNKAPGPMLLTFPFFAVFDRLFTSGPNDIPKEITLADGTKKMGRILPPSETTRTLMIFFFQLLPIAIIAGIIALEMKKLKISDLGINFFLMALLFGNTSTVLANVFMGHAMTAFFVLSLLFSLWRQNYIFSGLFFGCALLSEYTVAILLPLILIFFTYKLKRNFNTFFKFILGGVFPGILWIWYHVQTVGNPFKTVLHYQNPLFVGSSVESDKTLILGMFSSRINWQIIYELLLGPSRGILFTQPWIYLVAVSIYFFRNFNMETYNEKRRLLFFVLSASFLLVLINSSFNGWHGGWSAGPRYLAFLFPMWAFLAGFLFDQMAKWQKVLLWLGLAPSLLLRALVAGSTELAHDGASLWPFLWNYMTNNNLWGEMRFILFLSLYLVIGFVIWNTKTNMFKWGRNEN